MSLRRSSGQRNRPNIPNEDKLAGHTAGKRPSRTLAQLSTSMQQSAAQYVRARPQTQVQHGTQGDRCRTPGRGPRGAQWVEIHSSRTSSAHGTRVPTGRGTKSCHVMLCRVASCRVVSCHHMSCYLVSRWFVFFHPVIGNIHKKWRTLVFEKSR